VRAAVYLGTGRLRIEERPEPEPGPGEVLIAMRACGICGSDLMESYQDPRAPVVLGHEPAGVVVAAGERVDAPLPAPGRRVFAHHHVPCGTCEYCARGRETLCDTFKATRIVPGGLSELILVPARNARRSTCSSCRTRSPTRRRRWSSRWRARCAGSSARGAGPARACW
jgi:L-iditol 2-dehydrogenase